MTDVQIPLQQQQQQQTHQKGGMNGKLLPKNSLEIRGGGVANTSNSLPLTNTNNSNDININKNLSTNSNITNNSSIGISNQSNSSKKSLKLLDKSQGSLTNFQLYPIRITHTNNEKLNSFGTLVSLNYFYDVKTNSNSKMNINDTQISLNGNQISFFGSNDNNDVNKSKLLDRNSSTYLSTNNNQVNIYKKTSTNNINNQEQQNIYHWHDESNSVWTGTGVMSDRSSVYSIDDGDFDKEASRKVNNQLREIESILYEQNLKKSSNSIEYQEWLEKFPHIRILGHQIPSPYKDDHLSTENLRSSIQSISSSFKNVSSNFNSIIESSAISSTLINQQINQNVVVINSNSELNLKKNMAKSKSSKILRRRDNSDINYQSLNIHGTRFPITAIRMENIDKNSNEYLFLEEEIIDQDGVYEELFAYDNQEEEFIFENNKRLNINKRRRHGLPPITPKASIKDLVINILFDHIWSELIDWSSNTIKAYARTISEEFSPDSTIACKTPDLAEASSFSLTNSPLINDTNKDTKSRQLQSTSTNINISSVLNNNLNILNNSSSINALTAKTNIILLKPFDSSINNNSAISYSNEKSYTPGPLSRDNSSLNNLTKSIANNENILESKYPFFTNNNEPPSTIGDLISGGIDDILKIKQLNRNGGVGGVSSTNKNLAPLNVQSRIGSGTRRQYQTSNNYKKKYSSTEMSSNNNNILAENNKNIVIHGAGLTKPSSLHINDEKSSFSANNILNSAITNVSLVNSTNSFLPIPSSGVNIHNNRSNNNSSQAYHIQQNDESNFENDYNDYQFQNNEMNNLDNTIDEINLIHLSANNNQNHITNNNKTYYHNYHNHFYNYVSNNIQNNYHFNSQNSHQLPPIENSLSLKPLRISSANNVKNSKEKNERPMTSAATRLETTAAAQKRSTTPSGLVSSTNRAIPNNLYKNNMKITGIRLSVDDSIYANNNLLSTKSYASLANNNNSISNNHQTVTNRRNSKDSQGLIRTHK